MTYSTELETVPGRQSEPLTGVVVESPEAALSPLAQAAVDAGTSASTQRAYAHDWGRFEEWCAVNGRTPLPASETTLIEHVTYLAKVIIPNFDPEVKLTGNEVRGLSPRSIKRAMAAIASQHAENGLPMPSRKKALAVIKGYEEELSLAKDPRAKKQRAQAVTREGLRTIHDSTDPTQPSALRDRALVLLGFVLRARISELVAIDIGDIENTDRGLLVSVYRRKIRKHTEKAIPREYAPEMIDAVLAWIAALAAAGRTAGPLFPRIHKDGQIGYQTATKGRIPSGDPTGRLSTDGARRVIRRAFLRAGIPGDFTGHSLCRGFATEARFAGFDKIDITRGGDWHPESAAVDGYIEDADRWIYNVLKGIGF